MMWICELTNEIRRAYESRIIRCTLMIAIIRHWKASALDILGDDIRFDEVVTAEPLLDKALASIDMMRRQ